MDEKNCYVVGQLRGKNQTLCIGINANPPKSAYKHDIICLGSREKSEPNKSQPNKCKPRYISIMTPKEAIIVGTYLIRASILAEFRLKRNKEEDLDWAINWEKAFEQESRADKGT